MRNQHNPTPMSRSIMGRALGAVLLSTVIVLLGIALMSCRSQQPSAALKKALDLYNQNKLEQALPLLWQVARDENDAEAHAWLAETYRRLGKKDSAVIAARSALELDPSSSFAHTVIADACNPMYGEWAGANADTTWMHLQKAVACDSTDGNAWVSIWTESIRRGELPLMRRGLHALVHSGFLTRGALSYGRWMLGHIPQDAILIVNADMDTYPAVALQEVENFRPDVAVVNRSLLNTPWYARFIRDHYGVLLPFPDTQLDSLADLQDERGNLTTISDQIVIGWMHKQAAGTFRQPIAMSVTVDPDFIPGVKEHLRQSGAFSLWQPEHSKAIPDSAALRACLASVSTGDFTGPFVGARDRSPIRRTYTNGLVMNVTATALTYSQMLIKSGSSADALRWLDWAEAFERKTEHGPVFSEQIAELRQSAKQDNK